MKRVVLVLAAVLATGSVFGQGAANSDRNRLDGDWELVGLTFGGMALPQATDMGLKLTFKGNKVIAQEGGKPKEESVFKLDETKKPKQIQVEQMANGKPGFKGIYQLDGDQLKIGISIKEMGAAPESFDSKDIIVLALKRVSKQK